MGVALHGNLKDFGLAEVFQLIGQQRKTGVLEIVGNKSTMQLFFADGAVVTASPEGRTPDSALGDLLVRCGWLQAEKLKRTVRDSESSARSLAALLVERGDISSEDMESVVDLLTQETIFEVLRWTKGSFHFSAQAISHDRPPEKLLAAEQILMDGLRMVDEWQTFAEHVPSGDIVFERSGNFDVYRQQVSGAGRVRLVQAERLFQLLDGRLSARRVIDLSRLGTFEGTRVLAEFRQSGLVEVRQSVAALTRGAPALGVKQLAGRVRFGLAAGVPVLILAAAVASTLGLDPRLPRLPLQTAEGLQERPIEPAPLTRAQQAFEKRRLENALEAHRYLEGSWPDSLSELAVGDAGRPGALTRQSAQPYYYAAGEYGVVLLAPER